MKTSSEPRSVIQDPPIARFLFGDMRTAPLWLIVRVYVGWEWLNAGLHKLRDAAWMDQGKALEAFWQRIVQVPEAPARPPISFDWYRSFIQLLLDGNHEVWLAKVIAFGETAVGIALIVGAFVGIAAFSGAFMNFNFMLAGTASTNPVLFFLAVQLMLAWKTAGYIGLDRWLLVHLGTPWQQPRQGRPMTPRASPAQ